MATPKHRHSEQITWSVEVPREAEKSRTATSPRLLEGELLAMSGGHELQLLQDQVKIEIQILLLRVGIICKTEKKIRSDHPDRHHTDQPYPFSSP